MDKSPKNYGMRVLLLPILAVVGGSFPDLGRLVATILLEAHWSN